MVNLLFVCTGNICRSPAAEAIAANWANQNCADEVNTDLVAASAGTMALVGHPMEPLMCAELKNRGLPEPNQFQARRLNRVMANSADLILGMEQSHVDAVLKMAPFALKKTFTLGHLANLTEIGEFRGIPSLTTLRRGQAPVPPGVKDPYGQPPEVFSKTVEDITSKLVPVLDAIMGKCRDA